eukprot:m.421491 g.421491  ORF g.421491 m.421491 type:complete len:4954 (-) comp20197_c0_seq2:49-14910(-)
MGTGWSAYGNVTANVLRRDWNGSGRPDAQWAAQAPPSWTDDTFEIFVVVDSEGVKNLEVFDLELNTPQMANEMRRINQDRRARAERLERRIRDMKHSNDRFYQNPDCPDCQLNKCRESQSHDSFGRPILVRSSKKHLRAWQATIDRYIQTADPDGELRQRRRQSQQEGMVHDPFPLQKSGARAFSGSCVMRHMPRLGVRPSPPPAYGYYDHRPRQESTVSFRLRYCLRDGRFHDCKGNFTVEIDHVASSRVAFVVLRLRLKHYVAINVIDSYRALLPALFAPRLAGDVEPYRRVWAHALALCFFQSQTSRVRAELTVARAARCVGSLAEQRTFNDREAGDSSHGHDDYGDGQAAMGQDDEDWIVCDAATWDSRDLLTLWAFFGEAVMLCAGSVSPEAFPPILTRLLDGHQWGSTELQTWTHDRLAFGFLREGLSHICRVDLKQDVPTYVFLAALPVMQRLGMTVHRKSVEEEGTAEAERLFLEQVSHLRVGSDMLPELLTGCLEHAPSLACTSVFVQNALTVAWPPPLVAAFRDGFMSLLRVYVWPLEPLAFERDLHAFFVALDTFNTAIAADELSLQALKTLSFAKGRTVLSVLPLLERLCLFYRLQPDDLPPNVLDAVTVWCGNQAPADTSLEQCLIRWSNSARHFEKLAADSAARAAAAAVADGPDQGESPGGPPQGAAGQPQGPAMSPMAQQLFFFTAQTDISRECQHDPDAAVQFLAVGALDHLDVLHPFVLDTAADRLSLAMADTPVLANQVLQLTINVQCSRLDAAFFGWLAVLHRMICEVVVRVLDSLKGTTPDLPTLLDQKIWARFMDWMQQHRTYASGGAYLTSHPLAARTWEQLGEVHAQIAGIFIDGVRSVFDGSCTIGFIDSIRAHEDYQVLVKTWQSANEGDNVPEVVERVATSVDTALDRLSKLIDMLQHYSPEFPLLKDLLWVDKRWHSLTLVEVLLYMSLPLPVQPGESSSDLFRSSSVSAPLSPVPSYLIAAQPFLTTLKASKLFQSQFFLAKGTSPTFPALYDATRRWRSFYLDLCSGTILFTQIDGEFGELICDSEELSLLSLTNMQATLPEQFGDDPMSSVAQQRFPVVWPLGVHDGEWVSRQLQALGNFQKLRRVFTSLPQMMEFVKMLDVFIQEEGKGTLNEIYGSMMRVEISFKHTWESETLSNVLTHLASLQCIPERLKSLDKQFLDALTKSTQLLDWMRQSLENDDDFTANCEIAYGQSEADCPEDLWEDLETKISALASVRSGLHKFIFRSVELFPDIDTLLDVLVELRATDAVMVSNLQLCSRLLLAFVEQFSADSADTVAPKRLEVMLQSDRQATWHIDSEHGDGPDDRLWLQYEVPRRRTAKHKQLFLGDLMDFQSSLVLARATVTDPLVLSRIDSFIAQFARLRQLNGCLFELMEAGHFDYQVYSESIPVVEDSPLLDSRVSATSAEFDDWGACIRHFRSSFYYLNFFSVRQMFFLCNALTSKDVAVVSNFFRIIDADHSLPVKQRIKKHWNAAEASSSSAERKVELLGQFLQNLFRATEPRRRQLNGVYGPDQLIGVNVIVGEPCSHFMITSFARRGFLPEWEEIHLCSAESAWEDVAVLLHRWEVSAINNRLERLYAIVGVDKLPFGLQKKLSAELLIMERRLHDTPCAPLAVFSSSDSGHFVREFSHRRFKQDLLNADQLVQVGLELSEVSAAYGVQLMSGPSAGSGKSFQVRHRATSMDIRCVHVPIHRQMSVSETIALLHQQLDDNGEGYLLHLDLTATVPSTMDDMLLALVFVGCLVDPVTDQQFRWHPCRAGLAIELPSGPLDDALAISKLLAREVVEPSALNFKTNIEDLQAGMGPRFFSSRDDGTTPASAEGFGVNAYERLQYVLKVLRIQSSGEPQPSLFEPAQHEDIDANQGFRLLLGAMNLAAGVPVSMHSIWSFVNVVFWQLRDLNDPECMISTVCLSLELDMQPQRHHFKRHMVDFIINTGRDFAPGSVSTEGVPRWKDSLHQVVLFQMTGQRNAGQSGGGVTFLSLDPARLQADMPGPMRQVLQEFSFNGMKIGEDLDKLERDFSPVLSIITGVFRKQEEASALLDGRYCMTGDAILKMVAIFCRLRTGIPVVLMGEAGCGKTQLIKFLCAFINAPLMVLNVHGGTTELAIVTFFEEAKQALADGTSEEVYVFLDEINTCPHVGLFTEILVSRSIHGRRIPEGLHVLAALNPYRLRPEGQETPGLAFQMHNAADNSPIDDLARLVYRVYNVPESLLQFCFDYGSLENKVERLYIDAMIRRKFPILTQSYKHVLTELLFQSQEYVRHVEGDCSATSLRDVKRCLNLCADWFGQQERCRTMEQLTTAHAQLQSRDEFETDEAYGEYIQATLQPGMRVGLLECVGDLYQGEEGYFEAADETYNEPALVWWKASGTSTRVQWHQLALLAPEDDAAATVRTSMRSVALALAMVYYFRLARETDRAEYVERLQAVSAGTPLSMADFEVIVEQESKTFVEHLELDVGIAKNKALKENVFVVITCIINRIPIFVVGKPGTSKSLCLQLIASNLRGKQSKRAFWRDFPAVTVFPYQCSPMSTSASIQFQYDKALAWHTKKGALDLTVLLLDEVGLAEHSPDLPLKVLHEMLVESPVAIVGLSNWQLDPAKMNRAICLQRPDPKKKDLQLTSNEIIGGNSFNLMQHVTNLAASYHRVYTSQQGREFIGMRDYYSLLKYLRRALQASGAGSAQGSVELTPEILQRGLCRNFGGKANTLEQVLTTFHQSCFGAPPPRDLAPAVKDLVRENLQDDNSRHLMLLTRNEATLPLLFQSGLLSHSQAVILIGSQFSQDASELQIIQQLNTVKRAMALGRTLVLKDTNNLYEALYDILNQRFVTRGGEGSQAQRYLRIAVGKRSLLAPCARGFKIVAITDQQHAYEHLDLPLLNRFEKQVFSVDDLLSPSNQQLSAQVQQWVSRVVEESGLAASDVFFGLHESSVASLVLKMASSQDLSPATAVAHLAAVATPVAVLKSQTLATSTTDYFVSHSSLGQSVYAMLLRNPVPAVAGDAPLQPDAGPKLDSEQGLFALVVTRSPGRHLESGLMALSNPKFSPLDQMLLQQRVRLIQLADFQSEADLTDAISSFYFDENESPYVLLVQCDPAVCKLPLINHSRHVCEVVAKRRRAQGLVSCSPAFKDRIEALTAQHPEWHESVRRGKVPMFPRHVIFVVHVPAGVRGRERRFALDFYSPWECFYVDDLRGEDSVLSTLSLLNSSVHDLTQTNGGLNSHGIVLQGFRGALSQVTSPSVVDDHGQEMTEHWYPARIQMLKDLLNHGEFSKQFLDAARNLLVGLDQDERGIHFHVREAMRLQDQFGSLREALLATVFNLVVRASAFLIAKLDRNFGLYGLHRASVQPEAYPGLEELWFRLAQSCGAWSLEQFRANDLALDGTRLSAENDGKHGVLVADFPFSFALIRFLDAKETRAAVEKTSGNDFQHASEQLLAVFNARFGEQVSAAILSLSWAPSAYLHDYMNVVAPEFAGIELTTQLRIYSSVLRCTHADSVHHPAAMHVAFWLNETRLFQLCSLVQGCVVRPRLQENLVEAIEGQSLQPGATLMQLDETVMGLVVGEYAVGENFDYQQTVQWRWWSRDVDALEDTVSDFFASCSDPSTRLRQWHKAWEGILFMKMAYSEIMQPVLETGYLFSSAPMKDLAALSRCCETQSYEYFRQLLNVSWALLQSSRQPKPGLAGWLATTAPLPEHRAADLLSQFTRRYLTELVLTPTFSPDTPSQQQLLQAALEILFGSFSGLPAASLTLTLKKAVLHTLVAVDGGGGRAVDFSRFFDYSTTPLPALEVLQLYTQHKEDAFDQACRQLARVPAETEADIPAWVALLQTPAESSLMPMMDAIGNLRVLIRDLIALKLYERDQETDGAATGAAVIATEDQLAQAGILAKHPTVAAAVELALSKVPWLRVFALRVLLREAGDSALVDLLKHKDQLAPWMPTSWKMPITESEDAKLPFDPFGIGPTSNQHEEQYKRMKADAFAMLSAAGSNRLADTLGTHLSDRQARYLLGVFFIVVHKQRCQWSAPQARVSQGIIDDMFQWVAGSLPTSSPAVDLFRGLLYNMPDCSGWGKVAKFFRVSKTTSTGSKLRLQVMLDAAGLAMEYTMSWFHALLFQPASQKDSFMLTMPEDVLSMIMRAAARGGEERYARLNEANGGINGSVWYRCANGHPYSVGDCGRNVVQARCPCGAKIGGRDHTTVEGNTKIEANEVALEGQPERGYLFDCTSGPGSESTERGDLLPLTVRVLRFFMHSLLALACTTSESARGAEVSKLLKPQAKFSSQRAATLLVERIVEDWDALKGQTRLGDEDLALALHSVLAHMRRTRTTLRPRCLSPEDRARDEVYFQRNCVTPVFNGVREHVAAERERLSSDGDGDMLRVSLEHALGQNTLALVLEQEREGESAQARAESRLWRYRTTVTLDTFRRNFEMQMGLHDRFRTLRVFLMVESKLSLIRHLPAVLSWHAVLFEAFHNGLTRDEAKTLTNADAIRYLPTDRRGHAEHSLGLYCVAFNTCFPHVQFLLDCQRNHYSDLQMTADTPVAFSLPNLVKGEEGLEGCCTVSLLQLLQNVHNGVVLQYAEAMEDRRRAIGDFDVPPVNYQTNPRLVERQLVLYHRDQHLWPILHMFSSQELELATGHVANYDWQKINEALGRTLFRGKKPINLQVRHFQYAGEVSKAGLLSELACCMTQADLAPDVLAAIAAELDTQDSTQKLLSLLEQCISFIASIGKALVSQGGVIDEQTFLQTYVLETLLIAQAQWEDASTAATRKTVRLLHLRSLYLFLEELSHGNPLNRVLPQYRAELEAPVKSIALRAVSVLQLGLLLPLLRRFMLDYCVEGTFSPPPHIALVDYLGAVEVTADRNLQDYHWFTDGFPRSMLLRHTHGKCLCVVDSLCGLTPPTSLPSALLATHCVFPLPLTYVCLAAYELWSGHEAAATTQRR